MAIEDLQTIVMRFRDLVTERGQTIERHKEISERGGDVWWGWWSKFGETVPDDAFRRLVNQNGNKAFNLYLLDSGQELLYRAVCTRIHWSPLHERIQTPNQDRTPDYYNKQSFLAWFHLKDIAFEADAESILHNYSYLKVDEFFEDKQSRFMPFYGKQVSSRRELRQQDRTIWFLKTFEHGEPTHEILFQDAFSATPQHFPRDFFQTGHRDVLWVSDLHFSETHHAFPLVGSKQVDKFNLAHKIESHLSEKGVKGLAGIIVSGDTTWKADEKEFEMAVGFIRRLATWTPLRPEQIAVCPGNHDLKFSKDPADKAAPIEPVGEDSRAAYSRFYQQLFYLAPNEYLSSGRRLLIGRAVPLEVVCLNSSWLQQEAGMFQGHGFIGEQQLSDVETEMGWKTELTSPRPYRIAVLHHHILPTTYRFAPERGYPYSVVLDAEALVRWLVKHRVDLVLHGHMHQPFCAKVSRPLDVDNPSGDWHEFHLLGMGSSGVIAKDLGETKENTFGVLCFEAEGLSVSVYTIEPTNPSRLLWSVTLPLAH